jgi:hypothetical protein
MVLRNSSVLLPFGLGLHWGWLASLPRSDVLEGGAAHRYLDECYYEIRQFFCYLVWVNAQAWQAMLVLWPKSVPLPKLLNVSGPEVVLRNKEQELSEKGCDCV